MFGKPKHASTILTQKVTFSLQQLNSHSPSYAINDIYDLIRLTKI